MTEHTKPEHSTITYRDIIDRKRALDEPEARHLLASLPRAIARQCVNAYLADDMGAMETVLDHFIRNSAMSRLITENPGSSLAFETWYTRKPRSIIEWYYTNNKAGRQVYNRLRALEKMIPVWLNKLAQDRSHVLIDNIGSGPGRDMVAVLDAHPSLLDTVQVRNIDPDQTALEIGQRLAWESGLENNFSHVAQRLEEVNPQDADLLLLIGILCPLEARRCVALLRKMKTFCKPGGLIIFSTPLETMVREDPLADFVMRLHGWNMHYKTAESSAKLARAAGWEVLKQFHDHPLRFHCMTVARKPGTPAPG